VSLGIEPLRILEEIFAAHGGAVVDEDGEGVGGPFFAVCEEGLVWLAAAEADACWGPEAEGFFDDGEGVREVVDEVGVVAEDGCGGGGVGAENGVMFFSEGVEDLGVFA
jgi:hypothetical protein